MHILIYINHIATTPHYVGVSVQIFIVFIFGLNTKQLHFLSFESDITMCYRKSIPTFAPLDVCHSPLPGHMAPRHLPPPPQYLPSQQK